MVKVLNVVWGHYDLDGFINHLRGELSISIEFAVIPPSLILEYI